MWLLPIVQVELSAGDREMDRRVPFPFGGGLLSLLGHHSFSNSKSFADINYIVLVTSINIQN